MSRRCSRDAKRCYLHLSRPAKSAKNVDFGSLGRRSLQTARWKAQRVMNTHLRQYKDDPTQKYKQHRLLFRKTLQAKILSVVWDVSPQETAAAISEKGAYRGAENGDPFYGHSKSDCPPSLRRGVGGDLFCRFGEVRANQLEPDLRYSGYKFLWHCRNKVNVPQQQMLLQYNIAISDTHYKSCQWENFAKSTWHFPASFVGDAPSCTFQSLWLRP